MLNPAYRISLAVLKSKAIEGLIFALFATQVIIMEFLIFKNNFNNLYSIIADLSCDQKIISRTILEGLE